MVTKKTNPARLLKEVLTVFSLPKSPKYNVGDKKISIDGYTVEKFDCPTVAGYWSAASDIGVGYVLKDRNETIMSTTPMEIESHLAAQHNAKGRVVVAGLGLAMIATSLLKKRSVTKLSILDINETIMGLYPDILAGEDRAIWESCLASGRLQVLKADCTKSLGDDVLKAIGKVDYLWVDVWNNLGAREARPITENLCRQLNPKQADWWGHELEIAIHAIMFNHEQGVDNPYRISGAYLKHLKKTFSVPLSIHTYNAKELKLMSTLCFIAAKQMAMQERQKTTGHVF